MSSSSEVLHDVGASEHACEHQSPGWRTSLFGIYSKVFRVMLAHWNEKFGQVATEERSRELDELVLPSNEEWRHQVYYRLVDLQREIDFCADKAADSDDQRSHKVCNGRSSHPAMGFKWEWDPIAKAKDSQEQIEAPPDSAKPHWRLGDIVLAAHVLMQRESRTKLVYSDEAEMRRVFSLVYDVLQHKHILNQALKDAGFWVHHEGLRNRERIVWLILYDMQGRKFASHVQLALVEAREKIFKAAGLQDIERALIDAKTRLAASISRLRIAGNALTLEQLLPVHLRNEAASSDGKSLASGWINTIKILTKAQFITEMTSLGLELAADWRHTHENKYSFDPVCPKVVLFHENAREQLARSKLVNEHKFVFLDRSLCLGAAGLARFIRVAHLCGPVILTHSMAPRHTGYLAGLLADAEEAGRLLAFGAGGRREEYEKYLDQLGMNEQHCRVFAENYPQAPGFSEMERATIVLTIPPCSYTGLNDVVDLAIARGGDTELLESLTNVENEVQLQRPQNLLGEQISTLKYALTRPNVQLLVYEVHSKLPSETAEMLHQGVQYANRMATDKYDKEHASKKRSAKGSPHNPSSSSRLASQRALDDPRIKSSSEQEDEEESPECHVPESDLFEIGDVFDPQDTPSTEWPFDGCYLAVVRRKEMMQFNSLFMIKVAESKGLFGDPNSVPQVPQQAKPEAIPDCNGKSSPKERRGLKKSIRLDRIGAPTHSSMLKVGSRSVSRQSVEHRSSGTTGSLASVSHSCPRYRQRVTRDQRSLSSRVRESRRRDVRRWWEQSANFLVHAARCESCKFRIFHTDPWTRRVLYPSWIQPINFPDSSLLK